MPLLKSIFHGASHHAAEGREEVDNTSKMNDVIVVRVCFFLLSLPTKQCNRDVIMRAVTIWGQERSREVVSGCVTCERKRGVAKGEKYAC